jgi:hypothetical protein
LFFLRIGLGVMALLVALTYVTAATAFAEDPSSGPSPQPTVLIDPLDPRAGAGANRVGAPLVALVVVIGIGAAAAAATAVCVRVVRTR